MIIMIILITIYNHNNDNNSNDNNDNNNNDKNDEWYMMILIKTITVKFTSKRLFVVCERETSGD